jgi:hypothetical protein
LPEHGPHLARGSAVALIALAAAAPSASASITIGSDLTPSPTALPNGCTLSTPPCTIVQTSTHAGNSYVAKSPTAGTVTAFSVKSGGAESLTFRLAGLNSAIAPTKLTGDGTGPTLTLPAAGTYSVATTLAIKAGDYIGIDTSSTRAVSSSATCGTGAGLLITHPVLTNGAAQSVNSNGACEVLVSATVTPSNAFGFGKLKRNLQLGSASLTVKVPGPGKLGLKGKGVKAQSAGAVASKRVSKAGDATLRIRATGKAKTRLKNTGSVKVKVKVKFTPNGAKARTKARKVKLVKK